MKLARAVAAAGVGYLFGSLSFSRLVGRFVAPGEDLSQSEIPLSGGGTMEYSVVSATTVAMRAGPVPGIITGILDSSKSYFPTRYAMQRWPDEPYHVLVAAGAMAGHNWPLFHRFKGGRGQTPFYGGLAAMDWISIPVTTAAGIALGLGVFRDVLAAYSAGMWLTIPFAVWRRDWPQVAYTVIGNSVYSVAMSPEARMYFELRESGQIERLRTFKDFINSYPAMQRSEKEQGATTPADMDADAR